MQENEIYFFKMANGDNIIGEVLNLEWDPLTRSKQILIGDPMVLDNREINGQTAISLARYFAFSDLNIIEINSKDLMGYMTLSKPFAEYYLNTVRFNYLYVDRPLLSSVAEMNKIIKTAVSQDNQAFVEAMRRFNIDPDCFLNQLPN